ncbi:hypothetical protein [Thermococcus sp. Bubb.Bath]|uniref:hypothetical protein n=1 Tax=Thermococcus sp. Bubb.Bath TaxID=1638242 RepID=UPI0014398F11|nr:hypothetical protein [Thermococcus sp. Bubb.Bath]NJF25771.1 hypothetical protein [Thermococcus sp. Bubb.Bath]
MVPMACKGTDGAIKKIALGFVFLFLTSFLIIYYEIRRLTCATTNLCYASPFELSPMKELDIVVAIFVIGTMLISIASYYSSCGGE